MDHSRTLLPPMVSAAVALIAVTNYTFFALLRGAESTSEVIPHFLSVGLPTSVAIILLMSALYRALQETVSQLDCSRNELVLRTQRDKLTGVASREYFEEQLNAITSGDQSDSRFAVIMLDLDEFKRVNDLHGHQTGDALLLEASSRLTKCAGRGDTIARLGGDEFAILSRETSSDESLKALCAKICTELEKPYYIGGLTLRISASLGVVISGPLSFGPSDYMRAADLALYDAKARGRNGYQFFSEELEENLKRRDQLETDLCEALQHRNSIGVAFQPQIDALGNLTGVETLFRWVHPTLGDIPASEAVEIAEECNLISELGEFVFERAAEFARTYPELSVAINLSPVQFAGSYSFSSRMASMARKERVRAQQFEFEITERLFMEVGEKCEAEIESLRSEGFRVALDDFGTGYSSLSYLRRFHVDRLKLDKSFAEDAAIQESIALVRAAVSLAHLLGLEVVAEGIETEEQEAIALESGCDCLQGHYYGAPMSLEKFEEYVEKRLREAA